MMDKKKMTSPKVAVEVTQTQGSSVSVEEIRCLVLSFLEQYTSVRNQVKLDMFPSEMTVHVSRVTVSQLGLPLGQAIPVCSAQLDEWPVYVYKLSRIAPLADEFDQAEGSSSDERVVACMQWELPNVEFDDYWDSLVFSTPIKDELLQYANTLMLFSDKGVNSSLVTANRLILLHGPPGTGKTTLCKAVSQKLSVQMQKRYKSAQFVEINSHSLFSKWFSESGKLVMKMFEKIQDLLNDPECLVLVLIDEVESLTVARAKSMSGNEPSDAVRVVNALLTQIDFIRRWPNVLIFTTSNLSDAVDPAFLDRADVKRYIGPPPPQAIYSIYHSCILELQKAGIIDASKGLSTDPDTAIPGSAELSQKLLRIAERSVGMSGRSLRKLPVLAHAQYGQHDLMGVEEFLDALSKVLASENESKENIRNGMD